MNRKIAFFDIDGTLVNVPNGLTHPTKETIRVLNNFKSQGNYIVVATARGALTDSLKGIDFDGHIFCDGHYIEFNKQVLIDNVFTEEQVLFQMELFEKCNADYLFGGHHGAWINDLDAPLIIRQREIYQGTRNRPVGMKEDWTAKEVRANASTPLFKNVDDLRRCKSYFPGDWAINAYEDEELIRMDIHLPGFTKGTACVYLVEELGLNPDDAFAFGDGDNDVEMLTLIKHGIAMGNAKEVAKQHADYITDSVDNDGIAKAFKKYFDI